MSDPDHTDDAEPPEPCTHPAWEYYDASFDHEFGRQILHYWTCNVCGFPTSTCPEELLPNPDDF